MSAMRTGTLLATHTEDASKVKDCIKKLQAAGSYSSCFDPINIGEIDGSWVIIDGLHRAIAAYVCGVSATYVEEDSEMLTRQDIKVRNCYVVSKLGSKY
jgi:hypothetical protein